MKYEIVLEQSHQATYEIEAGCLEDAEAEALERFRAGNGKDLVSNRPLRTYITRVGLVRE